MESSEAGSMAASPVQLTQEAAQPDKGGLALSQKEREDQGEGGEGGGAEGEGGEGVSLLNDIAAALNKNKAKPPEQRKEKRKKWSFKRRKDSSSSTHDEGVGQVGGASEVPQEGKVTHTQFSWLPQVCIPLEGKTRETEVKGDVPGGQMTMILEAENDETKAAESSQNHTPTPPQPSPHRVRPRRKAPPPPQKVGTTAHATSPTHCVRRSLYLYVLCRRWPNPTLLFHPLNSPLPPHTPQSHPLPPHTLQRSSLMPNHHHLPSSHHTSPPNHPHLPSSQHMSPPHKPHLLPWAGHLLPPVRVGGNRLLSIGGSVVPPLVG